MQPIDRVLETILYVDDLEAARAFYQVVLGLELHSQKHGVFVFFRCGDGMLLLFDPEAAASGPAIEGRSSHEVGVGRGSGEGSASGEAATEIRWTSPAWAWPSP